ncbi:MAG: ABC transporter permease [Deltaproteobacteria bacterium]|nr:ABC transporter permease [Deltaproteobacteria bacterium]MCZ6823068.1 ABC transporter permease [Deltaproteobacteria bacterium]TDJ00429.1 MAG: ABC transporter permease [Deltaproteobacteria bacterium]
MGRYLIQRCFLLGLTFIAITIIGFSIVRLAPGDPVELFFSGGLAAGVEGVNPERLVQVEQAKEDLRRQLGLDQPLHIQYIRWLGRILHADLGRSFKDQRLVWDKIRERMPLTITLNSLALLITYGIAIPLGILSAVKTGSIADRVSTLIVFMLYSLPSFWVGTMIIIFLCGGDFLDWFPPAGLHALDYDPEWPLYRRLGDYLHHLAMPLLVTTYGSFAFLSRVLRSSMLEVKLQDYVRTARAKGVSERVVILRHILRNSIIPIVTNLGLLLPALIGGSVIIETIFSLPGLGYLGYQAVLARDYPVVLALFSVGSALTLVGILISDLLLVLVDPRISFEGKPA